MYFAYGVNQEILYVGKGNKDRYKHCIDGASSNKDLNRYFFSNGEDGSIVVKIDKYFNCSEDALTYEQECITKLKPPFNKLGSENFSAKKTTDIPIEDRLRYGYSIDLSKLIKLYIKAIKDEDFKFINLVDEFNPIVKDYIDVLSEERILKVGFNITKLQKLYNEINCFEKSKTTVTHEILQIIVIGERYSLSQITQILYEAYKKVDYSKNVKSTDIKNYFNVQDVWMTIDGKRCKGYFILEDLYKEIQYED